MASYRIVEVAKKTDVAGCGKAEVMLMQQFIQQHITAKMPLARQ